MLDYAVKMTKHHQYATEEDVQKLRDVGFIDADILHMIYWIGGFNMANTINDCVGLELHEHVGSIFVDGEVSTEEAGSTLASEVVRAGWDRARVRALESLPLSWLNSQPLRWGDVRGRTLLVIYWDVTHPNSLTGINVLNDWHTRFGSRGLTIIATHTPEFSGARDFDLLRRESTRLGIRYPVAHDPEYRTMQGANNRFWPAMQLIDAEGFYRFRHYGPGGFKQIEDAIERLLSGAVEPADDVRLPDEAGWLHPNTTPELFPGYQAGSRQHGLLARPGTVERLALPESLGMNELHAAGEWRVQADGLELVSGGGTLSFIYTAQRVDAFMTPPDNGAASASTYLDGRPLPPSLAGDDADDDGKVTVDQSRNYSMLAHPAVETHRADIELREPGVTVHRISFLPFRGAADD